MTFFVTGEGILLTNLDLRFGGREIAEPGNLLGTIKDYDSTEKEVVKEINIDRNREREKCRGNKRES